MSRFLLRWLTIVLVAGGVIPAAAARAEEATKYKPGDRVEVQRGLEWKPAVVVRYDDITERVDIKLDEPEAAKTPDGAKKARFKVFPSEVRMAASGAKAASDAKAGPDAKGTPAASEKVDASAAGKPAASDPNLEPREWSDRTGKFKVTARFKGLHGDNVVLESKDGKTVEVPLAKLSDDDVKLAKELNEKAESSNPFAALEAGADSGASSSSRGLAGDSGSLKSDVPGKNAKKDLEADWSSVEPIVLQDFDKWSYEPRPNSAPVAKVSGRTFVLKDVPNADKFFEKSQIFVSRDGNRAIINRMNDFRDKVPNYYNEVDLQSKKVSPLIMAPTGVELVDARPDDGLLLYLSKGSKHDKNTVGVGKIEGSKLIPLVTWAPYETEFFKGVDAAWLLSGERVLTKHAMDGQVTVWDFAKAKALFQLKLGHGPFHQFCLSDDRRLLAIQTNEGIAIIDLEKGNHLGTLPIEKHADLSALAFNDDSSRLAAVVESDIAYWDLKTGQLAGTIVPLNRVNHQMLDWADDFILSGGDHVYDTKRNILLWQFENNRHRPHLHGDKGDVYYGGKRWLVQSSDKKQPTTLIVGSIPNAAMLKLESSLGAPETLQVTKDGSSVAIELEIDPSLANADETRRAIADAASKTGWNVVEKSDLVIKAVCQKKPSQQIRLSKSRWPFSPFGRQDPEEIMERTITPHATYLMVLKDGKEVWKKGYLAEPGLIIHLEKEETIDQALDRLTKPNTDLLKNPRFPTVLMRPGKATAEGAYGSSPFSADAK